MNFRHATICSPMMPIEDADFMTCDMCRVKPRTSNLCLGCLHNRTLIDHYKANACHEPSLLRRLGLTDAEVGALSHRYAVKHSVACRGFNPKGLGQSYRCICDFFTQIIFAAWAEFIPEDHR